MARINEQFNLNTAGYMPAVFNPIEFKITPIDYKPLAQGLKDIEEREEKVAQQKSIINQTIAKMSEELPQDDETLNWLHDYVEESFAPMQSAIAAGDLGNALKTGLQLPSELINGNEFKYRKIHHTQYLAEDKRQRDRLAKGEIDNSIYKWWRKNNPETRVPVYDENGKFIGYKEYEPNFIPEDKLNWDKVYAEADKLTMQDKGSSSTKYTANSYNESGGLTNTVTTSGGSQFEFKTANSIKNTAKKLVGDNWKAFKQDFEVLVSDLNDLEEELRDKSLSKTEREKKQAQYNTIKELVIGANNVILSDNKQGWETYVARKLSDNYYAQGLAYDWRFIEDSVIDKPNKSGSGSGGNDANPTAHQQSVLGGYVEMPINIGSHINNGYRIAGGLAKMAKEINGGNKTTFDRNYNSNTIVTDTTGWGFPSGVYEILQDNNTINE